MVRRKGSERELEIAEALGFIKSMKESASFKNRIVRGFLEEKEKVLHEELFNAFFEKVNDSKED